MAITPRCLDAEGLWGFRSVWLKGKFYRKIEGVGKS
jgi:hypothetical protein